MGLKAALVDPLAMTALMQVYAEWSARLEKMSDQFRTLKDKAAAATRAPVAAPLPAPACTGGA